MPGAGEIDTVELRGYVAALHEAGYAKTTIARRLASLRSFFRFGQREGWTKTNPAKPLRNPRQGALAAALPVVATTSAGCWPRRRPGEPMGLRDRAILEVLYSAGLRVSELAGLNDGDLDLAGGIAARARQGPPRADRARRLVSPRGPCDEWLRRAPAHRRASKPGPTAPVFVNKFGSRLTTRSVGRMLEKYLQADRARPAHHAPHAAAQLRHAPARPRRRHPQRAGIAGPQKPGDHADLHPRQHGRPASRLRTSASAGRDEAQACIGSRPLAVRPGPCARPRRRLGCDR